MMTLVTTIYWQYHMYSQRAAPSEPQCYVEDTKAKEVAENFDW
jgi:hypothetical protein